VKGPPSRRSSSARGLGAKNAISGYDRKAQKLKLGGSIVGKWYGDWRRNYKNDPKLSKNFYLA